MKISLGFSLLILRKHLILYIMAIYIKFFRILQFRYFDTKIGQTVLNKLHICCTCVRNFYFVSRMSSGRPIIPIFIFDTCMCGNPGNPDTEKLRYKGIKLLDKEKNTVGRWYIDVIRRWWKIFRYMFECFLKYFAYILDLRNSYEKTQVKWIGNVKYSNHQSETSPPSPIIMRVWRASQEGQRRSSSNDPAYFTFRPMK